MDGIEYDQDKDDGIVADVFGPQDAATCLTLQPSVKVSFVTCESDIEQVESLRGSAIIGVDIEWRPVITKFCVSRPALLQMSSVDHVVCIDLLSLGTSKKLDTVLGQIFQDPGTILVGLCFKADLSRVRNGLPGSTFANKVKNYCDAATLYEKITLFQRKLTKSEEKGEVGKNLRQIT